MCVPTTRSTGAFLMLTPCAQQLLMTGNMLFEVLDPFLLWKQLYLTSRDEVEGIQDGEKERSSSLDLARFVIRTFRIHDEEVQKLHAPVVAFALLDTIKASSSAVVGVDPS